jgi:hypothetical protein
VLENLITSAKKKANKPAATTTSMTCAEEVIA